MPKVQSSNRFRFSGENRKITKLRSHDFAEKWLSGDRSIYSLDLISGFSCPFAEKCLAFAVEDSNGRARIVDGKNTEFRCFSASQEVLLPNVRKLRRHNFELAKRFESSTDISDQLSKDLPNDAGIVRFDVAGDLFSDDYFSAWLKLAEIRSDILFYGYTKNVPYWISNRKRIESIPNFVLTASFGGKFDKDIIPNRLRYARVYSKKVSKIIEATTPEFIDHDDSHAADPDKRFDNFALIVHGVQKKGSIYSGRNDKMKVDSKWN